MLPALCLVGPLRPELEQEALGLTSPGWRLKTLAAGAGHKPIQTPQGFGKNENMRKSLTRGGPAV